MTKFVPKEVLGDSTFVAVYDPESGETGYVRMGDLVDKSETTVTAVTSPGGGSRNRGAVVRAGDAVSGLPAGRLAELLSWMRPTHLPILDPAQFVGMTPITTTGMSIGLAAGEGDYSEDAIRVSTTEAVTNKSLLLPLPAALEAGVATRPVRAGQTVHFRIRCSDWSLVSRLYISFCQDGSYTNRRFINLIADSAGSTHGAKNPTYASRWGNQYRTFPFSATKFLSSGTPTAWGLDSRYFENITGIFFTVSASAAVTFDFDRIYSPEWPAAAVCPIFDGWYTSAREFVAREFLPRGWGAGGSANEIGAGGITPTYADLAGVAALGFDVFCHGHDIAGDGRPQAMSTDVTAQRYALILSQQRRALIDAGVDPTGLKFHQWLQNVGKYGGTDMAGLLRAQGVVAARRPASDAEWGIDPESTANTPAVTVQDIPMYVPVGGRFNRLFISAYENIVQGAGYNSAPVVPANNTLRKAMDYAAWAAQPLHPYHHNILDSPGQYDVSTAFAAEWVAHMDELERAGKIVVLNPTTLESLMWARPGDVFMRWDGEWVYRHDPTRIAF